VYPLKASANHRYLVDQRGVPFLMVGDSPQALIGNLSESDADFYFAQRAAAGYNAVWINLLCNGYTFCNGDGTTFDGISPFTSGDDLSTPNPAYFARVDHMLQLAANHNLVVLLDPIETGGWWQTIIQNGPTKSYNYGKFLAQRYKNQPNIIWMSGNDFQNWYDASVDQVVVQVAQGIKDNDPNHMQTLELDFWTSNSTNDGRWNGVVNLDAAYTYQAPFDQVLLGYNRNNMPVFMVEANYEGEHNYTDQGNANILRRQEYWTMLSGATGQLWGGRPTVAFTAGWKNALNTTGSVQFGYVTRLFASREWYNLVPDQNHTVVTAGYGTYATGPDMASIDYATVGRAPDGKLAMAYLPTVRTVTVDMSKLSGPVTARWYDPANGTFRSISGSPFPNSGSRQFTPPGNNSDGDGDWVLVLES